MNTKQQKFDAIVIGSGIGGLTVAALLSKIYQKRVLVLEQHFKAGGFTHTFKRKKQFHWDVGLHYVGEMYEGSTGKALFDYLTGTDAFSPGIMGAMMGGVKTAGLLDGTFGFFKIMKTAMQASFQKERASGN